MKLPDNIALVLEDTPEKFQPLAEEIVPPLVELLRKRNDLEREICARALKLREEEAAAGLPLYQYTPENAALDEEFFRRYLELAEPRCTEKILKWGPARSYGKPAKYDYLFDAPDAKVFFTMKSPKKALVFSRNPVSHDYGYRFTLRPIEGAWMIDGIESALGSQEPWGVEHSL